MTLVLVALLSQDPAITGERSIVSKCPVSDDAEYGYTKEKPVRVGGSPMFGPARERRYLQALVGPAGEPIAFKRRGSTPATSPDTGRILDLYEVTYAGAEKPIELYLDLYTWESPKAPIGFLCGSAIGLQRPGPDPFETHRKIVEAALRRSHEDLPPIPLEPGSTRRGMAFDTLRLIALAAREAARGGKPLTQDQAAALPAPTTFVVAHPVTCDGAVALPEAITFVNAQRQVLNPRGELLKGDALQEMVPGVELPDGAVGAPFGATLPSNGAVAVRYGNAACGTEMMSLPMTFGPPKKTINVPPAWPAGLAVTRENDPVQVRIRATIDVNGVPTELEVISGPSEFNLAAMTAVRQWRYAPLTINGAPVFAPITMTFNVGFRTR